MTYVCHQSQRELPMPTLAELALFCGGSEDSFTGELLRLMRKADPGNLARLRDAYPDEALALDIWEALPEPTFGLLLDVLSPGDVPIARCLACQRVAGMPSAPCRACPDSGNVFR